MTQDCGFEWDCSTRPTATRRAARCPPACARTSSPWRCTAACPSDRPRRIISFDERGQMPFGPTAISRSATSGTFHSSQRIDPRSNPRSPGLSPRPKFSAAAWADPSQRPDGTRTTLSLRMPAQPAPPSRPTSRHCGSLPPVPTFARLSRRLHIRLAARSSTRSTTTSTPIAAALGYWGNFEHDLFDDRVAELGRRVAFWFSVEYSPISHTLGGEPEVHQVHPT